MSTRKKFIIYLSILLVFCTVSAGYAFSSSSENNQSNSPNSPGSLNYISETPTFIEPPEPSSDPSMTVTTAPTETSAATTVTTKAPTTTKPSTIATTKPSTIATTKPSTSATTPSTTPAPANPSNIVLDNLLGQSATYVKEQFGNPVAIEKSEYGFNWYVYHKNYTGLVMIGIQNNKVVGLYSNSSALSFENIAAGTPRNIVRETLRGRYSVPLKSIRKGNTDYFFSTPSLDQRDVFTDSQKYVTIFYDNIKGEILTSVQIIDYSTEQSIGFFPAPDKGFTDSYERISFYLINSVRVRFNKPVLQYDNKMAGVAADHSQDMIDYSFFSHTSHDGRDPGERIKEAGNYRSCAENIAEDHHNAISAHESYMNSLEHRENILGDYKFVGVGVRMTQETILQTQDFITYQ